MKSEIKRTIPFVALFVFVLMLGGWTHGNTGVPSNFESTFAIGGGGYSKSMDVAADGTKVDSVDVCCGYIAQAGKGQVWNDVVKSDDVANTGIPPSFVSSGYDPEGPFDLRIAHSSSNILWMVWSGQTWKSTDSGQNWTSLSGTNPGNMPDQCVNVPPSNRTADNLCLDTQGNGTSVCSRLDNPKIAIDPTNPNHVIITTVRYGVWYTTDGTNFTQVPNSAIPQSQAANVEFTIPTPLRAILSSSGTNTVTFASAPTGPSAPSGLPSDATGEVPQLFVYDETTPTAIPFGTTAVSGGGTATITLSNNITGAQAGDVIVFFTPGYETLKSCAMETITAIDGANNRWYVLPSTDAYPAWSSTWNGSIGYQLGAIISYSGSLYISLSDTNINNTPTSTLGTWWQLFQSTDHSWSSSTTYAANQVVSYGSNGSNANHYISLVNGNTNNIPTSTLGTDWRLFSGVFESDNDGSSWYAIGGPTDSGQDIFVCDGNLYVVDNMLQHGANGHIWRYVPGSPGTWTNLGMTFHSADCDPAYTSTPHIAGVDGGGVIHAFVDSGGTPTELSYGGTTRTTPDAPWMALTGETFMSAGQVRFDPTLTSTLYFAEGIGQWYNTNPINYTTAQPSSDWTSQTPDQESLTTNAFSVGPGNDGVTRPMMFVWDRGYFYNTHPNSYNSPGAQQFLWEGSIIHGESADWAGAGTAGVMTAYDDNQCGMIGEGFVFAPGCTPDGGASWNEFQADPEEGPALIATAATPVGSSTLTFASVPSIIANDPDRNISDQGVEVFATAPINTTDTSFTITEPSSTIAHVMPGDNLICRGCPIYTHPLIVESVSGQTVNTNNPGSTYFTAPIPLNSKIYIQPGAEYITNQAAPDSSTLCFPQFRTDVNGQFIAGGPAGAPTTAHNTHISSIAQGGSCGASPEWTVTLDTPMSATDGGGNNYGLSTVLYGGGISASGSTGAPHGFPSMASSTSTTVTLTAATGYDTNAMNPDAVRIGDSVRFVGMWGGQLVRGAGSSNNMLWMPGNTGCYVSGNAAGGDCNTGSMVAYGGTIWPEYSTDGAQTWHEALLCQAPGPVNNCGNATLAPGFDSAGRSIGVSNYGTGIGGGPENGYLNIAADRVQAGTYYVVNTKSAGGGIGEEGGGVYMSNDGGVTWIRNYANTAFNQATPGGENPIKVAAAPGYAGHLFMTQGDGNNHSIVDGNYGGFWRSCNANSTTPSVTGSQYYPVDTSGNVFNVDTFGFGAPTPGGNGYPDVYFYGWVKATGGVSSGSGTATEGLWRGQPSTTCGPSETVTWTQVGPVGLGGKLAGIPNDVNGDLNTFGYFYLTVFLTGGSWGFHN